MKQELKDLTERDLPARLQGRYSLAMNTNAKGVTVAWCRLKNSEDLLTIARLLKNVSARLSTITASLPEHARTNQKHEIAYHFDLDGDTFTVWVQVPLDGEVESLVPLFRNADWNEREFMELYSIKVRGCTDHQRLFLDETIDPSILDTLIPFSTLVNAASTKTLWERILRKSEDNQ
jgi:NADH:ubiquinone oxidoreductase subunit C